MYIVTGGAGFIGSACVRMLNDRGIDEILVVDDLGHGEKWKNLAGKRIADYLHKDEFLEHLLEDHEFGEVRAVIHMGACSSTTETDAEYMLDTNYRYSQILAEWCMHHNIRLIYASSAATYGAGDDGFSDNDTVTPLLRPLNVYGYSKQLFDLWALRHGALRSCVGLKFFNVFGPNEYHKDDMRSVICKAFELLRSGEPLGLFKSYRAGIGDGEQKRDFIYIKDCVNVIWYLLEHPEISGLYNLGSGTARTWNDLALAVFSALGKKEDIEYIEMPLELREKYQYFTEAPMDKLRATGCPLPSWTLESAITDYVQNYLLKSNLIW